MCESWFHISPTVQQSSFSSKMPLARRTCFGRVNLRLPKIGSASASSLSSGVGEGRRRSFRNAFKADLRYTREKGTFLMMLLMGVLVKRMPRLRVESFLGMIQWSSGIFQSPSVGSTYLRPHLAIDACTICAMFGAPMPPADTGRGACSFAIQRRPLNRASSRCC